MLRNERKQNQKEYSINTTKSRQPVENKLGTKRKRNKQRTITNMVDINPTELIITLNINNLNAPLKKDCQNESKSKTQLCVV